MPREVYVRYLPECEAGPVRFDHVARFIVNANHSIIYTMER
jgi:hypothetical protein